MCKHLDMRWARNYQQLRLYGMFDQDLVFVVPPAKKDRGRAKNDTLKQYDLVGLSHVCNFMLYFSVIATLARRYFGIEEGIPWNVDEAAY